MDEINDFFNFDKKQPDPVLVSAGATGGRIKTTNKQTGIQRRTKHERNTNYAFKYEINHQNQMMDAYSEIPSTSSSYSSKVNISNTNINDDEEDKDEDEDDDDDTIDPIHLNYNFSFHRGQHDLPIMASKGNILKAIKENKIIIVQGATGCGKTTQVPQFILDEAHTNQKRCNIVVTQPRRIAAISNAERVAYERNWPLRTLVGYQIGLDKKSNCSEDTRILFCTTGILLEKLIIKKSFGNITHIILDEVHERNKDMDFLFIIIRKLLASVLPRPKIKIILMSATIDAEQFADYFKMPRGCTLLPAPIITIEKQSKFTINEFYFEDFRRIVPDYMDDVDFNFDEPAIKDELYLFSLYLINLFDQFDARERALDTEDDLTERKVKPTVLIFLPGINEIQKMHKLFSIHWQRINNNSTKLVCVILHSTSSAQHREMAMRDAPVNARKVILATNIAESSITVPDVKYVIDYCLTKNLVTDTNTNFISLRLDWAARSNCRQRAGRTGRVMSGRCYRFVTRSFYEKFMRETAIPEFVSSPLENIILKAKILDMGSPQSILALAMSAPKLSDIGNTILLLKEIGALLDNGDDSDGDLSFIGRIMAKLPIDVKIARLIILGYCFSILEETIIIGAALNCSKSIFRHSFTSSDGIRSYSQLLQWANGSGCDLIAMLHAYTVWSQYHNQRKFGTDETKENYDNMVKNEKFWGEKFFIDISAMYECEQQIKEITQRLEHLGIKPLVGVNRSAWANSEKAIILKIVIAGAFYPNIFARTTPDSYQYEREAFRSIGGLDPRNTVYFSGFNRDIIRSLYVKPIKNLFLTNNIVNRNNSSDVKVTFEDGANKCYVTFKTSRKQDDEKLSQNEHGVACMPGKIQTEVYKAIKMRLLKIPAKVRIIKSLEKSVEIAKERGLKFTADGRCKLTNVVDNLDNVCLPRILDKSIRGRVSFVESCDRFWFQPKHQYVQIQYFERNAEKDAEPFQSPNEISIGQILGVRIVRKFNDQVYFSRAKVIEILKGASFEEYSYRVQYIDHGQNTEVRFTELRKFRGVSATFLDQPPKCFECSLAELQPCIINTVTGLWPAQANKLFRNLTSDTEVIAEIYSVVNGIVNTYISFDGDEATVNQTLIESGLADYCEENYMSKADNSQRKYKQEIEQGRCRENYFDSSVIGFLNNEAAIEVEPPPSNLCRQDIKLNGPYSPLEIKTFSLTEAGKSKHVYIDRQSVNHILLENDPQNLTEKYLIAASVTSDNKNNLKLRHTTLLPNIRGFGPMVAAIFCPKLELKRDEIKSRYISLLTGLGCNRETSRPVFEEHDTVFSLDVEFTTQDISEINQIRYSMDTLLFTLPNQVMSDSISDSGKATLCKKIQELIIKLLRKPRKSIELNCVSHKWNEYDERDLLESHTAELYEHRAIFPQHNTLKLYTEESVAVSRKRLHCQELLDLSKLNIQLPRSVTCQLCSQTIENLPQLRIHLITRLHKDREYQIGFKTEEN